MAYEPARCKNTTVPEGLTRKNPPHHQARDRKLVKFGTIVMSYENSAKPTSARVAGDLLFGRYIWTTLVSPFPLGEGAGGRGLAPSLYS